MLAIGNNEIEKWPAVKAQERCPGCGKLHPVSYGEKVDRETGERTPSKTLAFVSCPEEDLLYLVGFEGKRLP